MKDIKVEYNHHLHSELQVRFSRIVEMLYWCPGGVSSEAEAQEEKSAKGAMLSTAKPNLVNPGFVVQYMSKQPAWYVVIAWNPTTLPPNCNGAPGSASEYWQPGVVPNTKVYRSGSLEDGVWFSIPAGDFEGNSSWVLMFDSLSDGRLLVATGKHVYVETAKGSDEYETVATVADNMDPAFLILSPNKQKVALGLGHKMFYDDPPKPILVFPVDILNSSSPPLLIDEDGNTYPGVTAYDVNYYSVAWKNDQYLFVNGGMWPGPPYQSGVGMLNTNNPNGTGQSIITNIPGSSSGICFDNYGNFFCGVGYSEDDESLIGTIRYFTSDQITSAMGGNPLDFSQGHYLCQSLSAGHMLVTPNDELVVCGGDYEGTTGHIGYAELFQLTYNLTYTGDGSISVAENRQLILDPCQNDSAAGPLCLIKEQ